MGGRRLGAPLLAVLLCCVAAPAAAQSADDAFLAALSDLKEASFLDKEAIADRVVATGHPSAARALRAFIEDRLYFRTEDGRVIIVATADESVEAMDLIDPVSLTGAGSSPPADLTRIRTNNRLRGYLRSALARFGLSNADPAIRLAAVNEMLGGLDEAALELLQHQAAVETDERVQFQIETALAMAALDGSDRDARLSAIATLASRLEPEVRNRLTALLDEDADGTFVEPDEEIRAAAHSAVERINTIRSLYSGVETLFFGLSLGSVLVLVAIGLAITFGVLGVINMALGELRMIGAYTTYGVQLLVPNQIDASIFVAIPAAFVVAGVAGVALERTVIRFLYGRPLETLLATFGVSLILQQLVRSLFSANNRTVQTPSWMSGTLQINEALSLTLNRLYIVAFTLIIFTVLLVVLKRTRLGLDIRAVSQNRAMARALGIRSARVDAMTFGLGAGIAGIAGVALSQLTNVGPNLGQAYIIDSFMVVVFGGVGNLWGTLIGGMSLGIVNKLLEPYAGSVLGKIFVLVGLILFIQRKPRGLFPQTGRAAEGT
jgi:urea transport system permease protein